MIDRIKRALREQDWRNAATLGGVLATSGSMACIVALPTEPFGGLAAMALAGIMVSLYSESTEGRR